MARQYDEKKLRDTWRALSKKETHENGWITFPVDSGSGTLFLAAQHQPDRQEAIFIGFQMAPPASKISFPDSRGFEVRPAEQMEQPGFWVVLHKKTAGSLELFTKMAADLLSLLEPHRGREAFEIFLHRIRAWQKFMERIGGPLSRAERIGLCGELELLIDLLNVGVPRMAALNAWTGPEGALHDFSFDQCALEVKSTAVGHGNIVQISSAAQLTLSATPLYLSAFRFAASSSGISLRKRINTVRDILHGTPEAYMLYESRLLSLGIDNIDIFDETERFAVAKKWLFSVSEKFPKIAAADLPGAVCNVQYSIDLSLVDVPETTLPEVLLTTGVVSDGIY